MKAIVESFEGSGIIVTQAKVSLQTTDIATKLQIKDQYEYLVKLKEMIESAKYTTKKVVHTIQGLDFGEDTCSINLH